MQTVKAKKALPGYQEGAIFSVDEDSAASLKARDAVEFVDDAVVEGGVFVHSGNANMAVVQVAPADYPEQPAVVGEPADGESGDQAVVVDGDGVAHTGTLPVTKTSNKADLVAQAVGKVTHDDGDPLSEAELESLTKAELVEKLGL